MATRIKYIAVVEYNDRLTKTYKELPFFCDVDKNPSIGDFVKLFRDQGLEMEIVDFADMIFQPIDKTSTKIAFAKINRTFKDYTHNGLHSRDF
ncbi:hypothetical protein GCM10008018_00910 [Paenibacillus marchantiophytorum]|uniref:Uncharacterized protein n=1 Tax=Paenibacillus marchantiophytorum TaxID=1619310 RepID=A0ABQ2BPS0_9BACL|nr:hypothetical protein [Paenibacillus marchantiophytorum]GGI43208.1 hypothetical protein GCM10008018_00910 [Paenibacillus marchantiophytorum]